MIRRNIEIMAERLPYVTLLLNVHGNTDTERWALEQRRAYDKIVAGVVQEAIDEGDVRADIEAPYDGPAHLRDDQLGPRVVPPPAQPQARRARRPSLLDAPGRDPEPGNGQRLGRLSTSRRIFRQRSTDSGATMSTPTVTPVRGSANTGERVCRSSGRDAYAGDAGRGLVGVASCGVFMLTKGGSDQGPGPPPEMTSFVGRRRDVAEVKRLLGESRLVTLTGIGGVGKTRLAQRVADQLRRLFADGVWFLDLSAVEDPALAVQHTQDPEFLAHLVALALGLRQESARPPLDALADHLRQRSPLLVLDNCEHVLPAAAEFGQSLLRGCPALRILTTSREPLGIAGERLFAVPPLAVPHPGASLAEVSASESVALFAARGQAALPAFELSHDNEAVVAAICREMEGLPLAIELASSWLPVLAPQQILDRLTDRFALLSRASRSAPKRQQTLRACVDWSFELCSKSERLLWARLSVFLGGCELDAIEGVCAGERLPAAELLEVLAGLVEKSILSREDDGEVTRYRMLATLRDYGREKLYEFDDYDEVRRRHRDWYLGLVDQARAEWISDRQAYWYRRLSRAHADLRAAMEYSLSEDGQAESALRIAMGLPSVYWWTRGMFGEGRRWLDRSLAQAPAATGLRARALILDSELAFMQGDAEAGTALLNEGEHLARQLNEEDTLADAATVRGVGAIFANDVAAAMQSLESGLRMLAHAPNRDPELRPQLLLWLGRAAELNGDYDKAISCAGEVLAITEHRGETIWRSYASRIYAFVAWRKGKLGEAVDHARNCLLLSREIDDRLSTALTLEILAWINADQRRHRRAAHLLGAADAFLTDLGSPISSYRHLTGFHSGCERGVRASLGDSAFQDAFAAGRELTPPGALTLALEQSATVKPPATIAPRLTPRERQVAQLVAEGLSNREIAARLVISPRTAETHVENILTKLGFTSRASLAAWVSNQQGAEARP